MHQQPIPNVLSTSSINPCLPPPHHPHQNLGGEDDPQLLSIPCTEWQSSSIRSIHNCIFPGYSPHHPHHRHHHRQHHLHRDPIRIIMDKIRYALKQKNDIIWEFFPNVGPPPIPPFWEPLIQKFFLVFILHFRS